MFSFYFSGGARVITSRPHKKFCWCQITHCDMNGKKIKAVVVLFVGLCLIILKSATHIDRGYVFYT